MNIKNYNLLNNKKRKHFSVIVCFSNMFIKCFAIMFVLILMLLSNLIFTDFFATIATCINSFFDCFGGEFVRLIL